MKKRIIPIFVPHRGCPHDCIFCNQKKITGVNTDITKEDVKNIIEEYLTTIDRDAEIEIAFFGGSFTAIDIDIQKSLLSVAKEYVEQGVVKDIRLSTRPDCIDENILSMLKQYGVTIIELGVQSLDEEVLKESIRGHSSEDVFKSAELIKEYDIKLGLQMMVGLPTDTQEKCIFTARKFIELNPDCVRIYPTLVVKETGLENLLNENKYNVFTLEESIYIVKKLLTLFYVNNINVIRVGLQATDDIQIGKAVIDGPYHPAFRELVEGEMIKDYLKYIVEGNKVTSNMLVNTNRKNISKIIGNKKTNSLYMKKELGIKLKTQEENLPIDKLEIALDEDKILKVNMGEIYTSLYKIYNL